jgi:UDP:flavonoid glycosyltransferase YjiC (YdhE family)
MRTVRILFSCPAAEGHFRPMLPLAHALERLGHEVAFATAASWEPRVAAEGFRAYPAGIAEAEVAVRMQAHLPAIMNTPVNQRRIPGFSRRFGLVHAPAKITELLEIGRSWQPEAIVHDSGDLAAPLAATALGLPSVNHSFGAMVPLAAIEEAGREVAPLWRSLGLAPDRFAGLFRGAYVDICPPALAWEDPPAAVIKVRPCDPEPPDPPEWFEELGRPLIYVTMGTAFNEPALYRPLLDGLAQLDGEVAALVTTGRTSDPAGFGPLPDRVRIEQYVPQARVLPSCDVVVSHGGSGTTLGALAHGLPLLLAPQGADQFDNAIRCREAGAAIVITPEEMTPARVSEGVIRLIDDPELRRGAERVAAEIAAMPSADEAALEVEHVLAAR